MGISIAKAAKLKAGTSANKNCSEPQAVDEIQSDDKIPSGIFIKAFYGSAWVDLGDNLKKVLLILYEIGSFRCACSVSALEVGALSLQNLSLI